MSDNSVSGTGVYLWARFRRRRYREELVYLHPCAVSVVSLGQMTCSRGFRELGYKYLSDLQTGFIRACEREAVPQPWYVRRKCNCIILCLVVLILFVLFNRVSAVTRPMKCCRYTYLQEILKGNGVSLFWSSRIGGARLPRRWQQCRKI